MKTPEEILELNGLDFPIGISISDYKLVIKSMEDYAQMKVNELNKSDVIKSVCEKCGEPLVEDMNTKELFCPILICK